MGTATSEIHRDIAAVFFTKEKLAEATNELSALGLKDGEISLLCTEQASKTLQNDFSQPTARSATQGKHADLVQEEGSASTVSATFGGLSLVATSVGGAAIVASAGIFGGAVAVATAASVVAGGLGALAGAFMSKSDADVLQNEIDAGHFVLVVRAPESELKDQVIASLEQTSGVSVRQLKGQQD